MYIPNTFAHFDVAFQHTIDIESYTYILILQ